MLCILDPSKRESRIPIIQMKQGNEPSLFTGFFNEWDPQMWKVWCWHLALIYYTLHHKQCNLLCFQKEQKFEEIRDEIERQKPLLQVDLIVTDSIPNFYECDKYPLNILLERDPEKLPVGIDVQHKEVRSFQH